MQQWAWEGWYGMEVSFAQEERQEEADGAGGDERVSVEWARGAGGVWEGLAWVGRWWGVCSGMSQADQRYEPFCIGSVIDRPRQDVGRSQGRGLARGFNPRL